jgi:ferrochelatase
MARTSPYVEQLQEACRLVSQSVGREGALVYQSRSGPPSQPWLEPDVCQHIRQLHDSGVTDVVLAPIGFLSDHMEVVYDLDTEAAKLCRELGVNLSRAGTVGIHPAFVSMLREMIAERADGNGPDDECRPDCCALPARPARP